MVELHWEGSAHSVQTLFSTVRGFLSQSFLCHRGGKFQAAQEGGVRVPGIMRWPGKVGWNWGLGNVDWCLQVTPGSELAQPSSQMDIMPTLVELARGKLPKDLLLDGVSMAGGGSRQEG